MKHEDTTDVLVVGAGPVGMLAALVLVECGVRVKIIDQAPCTTSHSYACVLHPHALKILDDFGLATDLVQLGQRIDGVAFYDSKTRRASLDLSSLPGRFPFALVLPQSELEEHLEARLNDRGVSVGWNHRLASLTTGQTMETASIDTLDETATGYIVPRLERMVKTTARTHAAFVVGADGHESVVRQVLGIEMGTHGAAERFGFYEIEASAPTVTEARAVLGTASTDILWPMANSRCRWTFQLPRDDDADEYPRKERMAVLIKEGPSEHDSRHHFQKLAQERAPWFNMTVKEVDWSAEARIERRLVRRFGVGRCWLMGDAAHQARPLGAHSLNAGLAEAYALGKNIAHTVHGENPLTWVEVCAMDLRRKWERSEDAGEWLKPRDTMNPWVREHRDKILHCLPASGDELEKLAEQLGFGS